MTYPLNTHGKTQDQLNDMYSALEVEASEICGLYFNIRKSAGVTPEWRQYFQDLNACMQDLAKNYNASSLPF